MVYPIYNASASNFGERLKDAAKTEIVDTLCNNVVGGKDDIYGEIGCEFVSNIATSSPEAMAALVNMVLIFSMVVSLVNSDCAVTKKGKEYLPKSYTAGITHWIHKIASLIYIYGEIQNLISMRKLQKEFEDKSKEGDQAQKFRVLIELQEEKIDALEKKLEILEIATLGFGAAGAVELGMSGAYTVWGKIRETNELKTCQSLTAKVTSCGATGAASATVTETLAESLSTVATNCTSKYTVENLTGSLIDEAKGQVVGVVGGAISRAVGGELTEALGGGKAAQAAGGAVASVFGSKATSAILASLTGMVGKRRNTCTVAAEKAAKEKSEDSEGQEKEGIEKTEGKEKTEDSEGQEKEGKEKSEDSEGQEREGKEKECKDGGAINFDDPGGQLSACIQNESTEITKEVAQDYAAAAALDSCTGTAGISCSAAIAAFCTIQVANEKEGCYCAARNIESVKDLIRLLRANKNISEDVLEDEKLLNALYANLKNDKSLSVDGVKVDDKVCGIDYSRWPVRHDLECIPYFDFLKTDEQKKLSEQRKADKAARNAEKKAAKEDGKSLDKEGEVRIRETQDADGNTVIERSEVRVVDGKKVVVVVTENTETGAKDRKIYDYEDLSEEDLRIESSDERKGPKDPPEGTARVEEFKSPSPDGSEEVDCFNYKDSNGDPLKIVCNGPSQVAGDSEVLVLDRDNYRTDEETELEPGSGREIRRVITRRDLPNGGYKECVKEYYTDRASAEPFSEKCDVYTPAGEPKPEPEPEPEPEIESIEERSQTDEDVEEVTSTKSLDSQFIVSRSDMGNGEVCYEYTNRQTSVIERFVCTGDSDFSSVDNNYEQLPDQNIPQQDVATNEISQDSTSDDVQENAEADVVEASNNTVQFSGTVSNSDLPDDKLAECYKKIGIDRQACMAYLRADVAREKAQNGESGTSYREGDDIVTDNGTTVGEERQRIEYITNLHEQIANDPNFKSEVKKRCGPQPEFEASSDKKSEWINCRRILKNEEFNRRNGQTGSYFDGIFNQLKQLDNLSAEDAMDIHIGLKSDNPEKWAELFFNNNALIEEYRGYSDLQKKQTNRALEYLSKAIVMLKNQIIANAHAEGKDEFVKMTDESSVLGGLGITGIGILLFPKWIKRFLKYSTVLQRNPVRRGMFYTSSYFLADNNLDSTEKRIKQTKQNIEAIKRYMKENGMTPEQPQTVQSIMKNWMNDLLFITEAHASVGRPLVPLCIENNGFSTACTCQSSGNCGNKITNRKYKSKIFRIDAAKKAFVYQLSFANKMESGQVNRTDYVALRNSLRANSRSIDPIIASNNLDVIVRVWTTKIEDSKSCQGIYCIFTKVSIKGGL